MIWPVFGSVITQPSAASFRASTLATRGRRIRGGDKRPKYAAEKPTDSAVAAALEAFVHFQMGHAGLLEYTRHRLVPTLLVEVDRGKRSVKRDPVALLPPSLRFQNVEQLRSHARRSVRLQDSHPTHLGPAAGFAGGRLSQRNQPSSSNRMPAVHREHVEGAAVVRVALETLRHMLLLDEDDLADGQRLQKLALAGHWNDGDLPRFGRSPSFQ